MSALADLGLFLDIIGAIILVRSIILNPDERIAATTGAWWGANPYLVAGLIEQKYESVVGLCALVAGFLFQFSAASGFATTPEAALLFLAPLLAADYFRDSIVVERTIRAVRTMDEIQREEGEHEQKAAVLRAKLHSVLRGERSVQQLSKPE